MLAKYVKKTSNRPTIISKEGGFLQLGHRKLKKEPIKIDPLLKKPCVVVNKTPKFGAIKGISVGFNEIDNRTFDNRSSTHISVVSTTVKSTPHINSTAFELGKTSLKSE